MKRNLQTHRRVRLMNQMVFVKDEVEDSDLLEDIAGAIKIDGDSRPKPKPVGHLSQ